MQPRLNPALFDNVNRLQKTPVTPEHTLAAALGGQPVQRTTPGPGDTRFVTVTAYEVTDFLFICRAC